MAKAVAAVVMSTGRKAQGGFADAAIGACLLAHLVANSTIRMPFLAMRPPADEAHLGKR